MNLTQHILYIAITVGFYLVQLLCTNFSNTNNKRVRIKKFALSCKYLYLGTENITNSFQYSHSVSEWISEEFLKFARMYLSLDLLR